MIIPEKLVNSVTQWPILRLTRRVGFLVLLSILALLFVWSIDQSTVTLVLDFWRYPTKRLDISSFPCPQNSKFNGDFNATNVSYVNSSNVEFSRAENPDEILANPRYKNSDTNDEIDWVTVEFEQNYSSNLLSWWLAPGGEPCKDSRTVEIRFVNFDDEKAVNFLTGKVYEVFFQALDESRNVVCVGGDYFEIDLSGELWKSRPPIKDWNNGTYSFTFQVHPDFAGAYNLTIILLFRHFEGLKYSTSRFGYDKQLRKIPVTFSESKSKLPELHECRKSDFRRDVWAGRWTRHAQNDACEISNDGRYRCLEADYPCTYPWCNGSLGLLESNGWVYSAHCSFRLFSSSEAWNCLNNRWLFFWGDSNHVDTIRNMLFFFLGVPYKELDVVSRHFDMTFTSPKDESQSVRITNVFNGHYNLTLNYQGLNSLSDEGYRDLLKSYFNGSTVPDTVVFNSGLHDGIHWKNVRRFIGGAEYAASFWKEMIESIRKRGLKVSQFIYRSTITTGGYARTLQFNPSKMEAYNGILLEKLKEVGLVTEIIDDFDMSWAWHFDNRCNDGVHYGRFPAKMKWRDGQIGHHYFVDLMLAQVLFNAFCAN